MAPTSPQIRQFLRSSEVRVFLHHVKRDALPVWQSLVQFSTWCVAPSKLCSNS
jgi:hypothetical protein